MTWPTMTQITADDTHVLTLPFVDANALNNTNSVFINVAKDPVVIPLHISYNWCKPYIWNGCSYILAGASLIIFNYEKN